MRTPLAVLLLLFGSESVRADQELYSLHDSYFSTVLDYEIGLYADTEEVVLQYRVFDEIERLMACPAHGYEYLRLFVPDRDRYALMGVLDWLEPLHPERLPVLGLYQSQFPLLLYEQPPKRWLFRRRAGVPIALESMPRFGPRHFEKAPVMEPLVATASSKAFIVVLGPLNLYAKATPGLPFYQLFEGRLTLRFTGHPEAGIPLYVPPSDSLDPRPDKLSEQQIWQSEQLDVLRRGDTPLPPFENWIDDSPRSYSLIPWGMVLAATGLLAAVCLWGVWWVWRRRRRRTLAESG